MPCLYGNYSPVPAWNNLTCKIAFWEASSSWVASLSGPMKSLPSLLLSNHFPRQLRSFQTPLRENLSVHLTEDYISESWGVWETALPHMEEKALPSTLSLNLSPDSIKTKSLPDERVRHPFRHKYLCPFSLTATQSAVTTLKIWIHSLVKTPLSVLIIT